MSPPGIPFFYAATEEETALAELRGVDGELATVALWATKRDLHIVDLSRLSDVPSIFDTDRAHLRDDIAFLHRFAMEISKPIRAHDDPAVDYVPTQVVAEYVRHCVRTELGDPIEGIMYPSAVRPSGTNIAFFVGPDDHASASPLLHFVGPPRTFAVDSVAVCWVPRQSDDEHRPRLG